MISVTKMTMVMSARPLEMLSGHASDATRRKQPLPKTRAKFEWKSTSPLGPIAAPTAATAAAVTGPHTRLMVEEKLD